MHIHILIHTYIYIDTCIECGSLLHHLHSAVRVLVFDLSAVSTLCPHTDLDVLFMTSLAMQGVRMAGQESVDPADGKNPAYKTYAVLPQFMIPTSSGQ